MVELIFLKELMLIKQENQKSVIFATFFFFDIWYFLNKRFQCQPYVCNRYHDLLMMSVNLSYIAILKIKNTDYSCIINRMSKSEAIKLLQNIDSTEKT